MPRPVRPSASQLSQVGIEIVRRDPLTLRCQTCHVEWHARRGLNQRLPRNYWKCRNGCNTHLG